MKQDYPKYQVIFSVADEDDQALDVVRELLQKYPKVDAKINITKSLKLCSTKQSFPHDLWASSCIVSLSLLSMGEVSTRIGGYLRPDLQLKGMQ